jgi:transcriptional repressor NrdR
MVNGIVRRLESLGETELASHVVGEMVMKALKAMDDVAYVRYASVYRDFRQTDDFARFLSEEGLAEDLSDDLEVEAGSSGANSSTDKAGESR